MSKNILKVESFHGDLGNSNTFGLINGDTTNILEIPTACVEYNKEQALAFFTDNIPKKDLKNSLLIKYEGKYYLIGEEAKRRSGNDEHIRDKVANKSDSKIPYLMFLALVALHEANELPDSNEDTTVEIDYFSTMLPIGELTEAPKFSIVTDKMAERFLGDTSFEIVTKGCEKKIHINVKESKCYPEGWAAKWALAYTLDLKPSELRERFADCRTINVDIGGGSIDLVRLQFGLGNPNSRDDYKPVSNHSYLKMLRTLRNEKLSKYFESAKDLEDFIVQHFEKGKYLYKDGKTSKETDLTGYIDEALENYTNTIMPEILSTFDGIQGVKYKYNYIGGVAPILRKYIEKYVINMEDGGEEVFKEHHHIEPNQSARFSNLVGLEIIYRNDHLPVNK